MSRDPINIRFWQAANLLKKIGKVADTFYDLAESWLRQVAGSIDPDSAPIVMVELLGWERNIERFVGEDDALFRKRVKYALPNALDAGSKLGFERIWQRLGLGAIRQTERFDSQNWDVIRLRIDEEVFGRYVWLLDTLIRHYGRTCRRYELESQTTALLGVRSFGFAYDIENIKAIYA